MRKSYAHTLRSEYVWKLIRGVNEETRDDFGGVILDAARRALSVGAVPVLSYKGMGAEGVVFCDRRGHAFKVGRHQGPDSIGQALRREAEWFYVASQIPEIRRNVARFIAFYKDENVLERECIEKGYTGRRPNDNRWELNRTFLRAMRPYGRGAPEFKEDSFVYARGRGYVLVDGGFSCDTGRKLVERALYFLRHGDVDPNWTARELSTSLAYEAGRTVDRALVSKLRARLVPYGADPE